MGEVCRELGKTEVTIDLMGEESYPTDLKKCKALNLAISALKDKFHSILIKREMKLDFVKGLKLKFVFYASDNYLCTVESTLVKVDGTKHIQMVK